MSFLYKINGIAQQFGGLLCQYEEMFIYRYQYQSNSIHSREVMDISSISSIIIQYSIVCNTWTFFPFFVFIPTMSAEKSLALPKASVKRIMKLSDEVQNVSAEAVIAVSKVTEDFLNQIVAKAHEVSQAHNRKTIKVWNFSVEFDVSKF